ncbi:MAG: peptide chain release factor N(5)-glutamine methyltransferase [Neomegalonema sp.]|nr:peptide chain release factor N(5)-glutamine methyltransferase [Neomegalonema sp.]
MKLSLDAAVRDMAARLRQAGAPDPLRDATVLARWAVGMDGAAFAAARNDMITEAGWARLQAATAERERRRPVSHIIGRRAFFGRDFFCDARALDPRPESETLVEAALGHLRAHNTPAARILDLGVGSGCLLASVLAEQPGATGVGVDQSAEALELAAENMAQLGLAGRAELRHGDWLEGVNERFDVILCNPPYISESEIEALAPEVRLFEPWSALTPGADGLFAYRSLAPLVPAALTEGGAIFFEVGIDQAPDVAALLSASGMATERIRDLNGVERIVVGQVSHANAS